MIKIYIGDATVPIYVSQQLLACNSSIFESFFESDSGANCEALHLPDDELDAWKLMLFWMTYKQVPSCEEPPECQISVLHISSAAGALESSTGCGTSRMRLWFDFSDACGTMATSP